MATKLGIYTGALRLLGERRLASLTEDRSSRHELDSAYDDAVAECLESGYWNFAMRTVEIEPSDDAEPQFGYTYAYEKPDDWVRTYTVSASERFDPPLEDYQDEAGYWFCDIEPVYLRYVSNDADWGLNIGSWPRSFAKYVETTLAVAVCLQITSSSEKLAEAMKVQKKAKSHAKANDAMNEPSRPLATGTWVNARDGGMTRMRSRWNGRFS